MRLGSTYLRKDGRWESRLSLGAINGKRQSKSFYGSTRDEAEGKLIAAVMGSVTTEVTGMTVRELCLEWLSVSAHRVKLSTLANYRMKIEKHIIPQFGDMMCCEVTSKMAYGFMQNKLDEGLSPRYVADIMVLLKTVFKNKTNIVILRKVLADVRDVFVNRIAGYIYTSTDSIVISAFISTIKVGFYANYMTIVSSMRLITNALLHPIVPSIGSRLVSCKDGQSRLKLFYQFSHLRYVVAIIFVVPTSILIDDFIVLWVGKDYLLNHPPTVGSPRPFFLFPPLTTLYKYATIPIITSKQTKLPLYHPQKGAPAMPTKPKIAGYTRISVDIEQDRDNTSIENQKSIIKDYVSRVFPGSELDLYEDCDRSGYTFEQREGYMELRPKLIGLEYDILIVKDFSRFSRRNSKGLVELEDIRDNGVRIISIGDSIDYPTQDDWQRIQMLFLFNELPVTDASRKVKSVIQRRQEDPLLTALTQNSEMKFM